MNLDKPFELVRQRLAPWAEAWTEPEGARRDMVVRVENLLSTVLALQADRWGYLTAITGLDLGPDDGQIEVLYHFCQGPAVLTLRVPLPRGNPAVPSLSSIIPIAAFFERELREMLGVTVAGLLAPAYLYLPEDWPAGVYPLRKDAALPPAGVGG